MQYACIMRFRREANESQLPVAGRDVRAAHRTASLSFARLMRDHSLAEIARRFDRSATWVSRRLALVELLPESIQHQVREGKIAAQVAMKFLVPVARQSPEDCQRISIRSLRKLSGWPNREVTGHGIFAGRL